MTSPQGRRPSALLVDDSVAERDLYELVLKEHFQILTANRGADAVAVAASDHPDIIVLDVMMPGLTGWETCARIKSNPATADIPVVLLTGVDDVDLTQHAFAVGADDVLNKPCPAGRLLECVRAVLDAHRKERTPQLRAYLPPLTPLPPRGETR
jgi:DNA-binding response OmpR family regulator